MNEFHCYWDSEEGIKVAKGSFCKQAGLVEQQGRAWTRKRREGGDRVSVGRVETGRKDGAWGWLRG